MATSKETWKTDTEGLQRRIPFLGNSLSCSWKTGIAQDRSGGVPGPSAGFLRGYAVLSPEDLHRIKAKYSWKEVLNVNVASLDVPSNTPLVGPVLVSQELIRSLPTESVYHQGRVFLVPDSHIIYFDLLNN